LICAMRISSVELKRGEAGIAASAGVDGRLRRHAIVEHGDRRGDVARKPHAHESIFHGGEGGIDELLAFSVGDDRLQFLAHQFALARDQAVRGAGVSVIDVRREGEVELILWQRQFYFASAVVEDQLLAGDAGAQPLGVSFGIVELVDDLLDREPAQTVLLEERGFSALAVLVEQVDTGGDDEQRNDGENDQTLRLLHSKNLLPVIWF